MAANLPANGAWQEAVVCVRDLERWREALQRLFGWQVECRGQVDPRLLQAWGLPPQARGEDMVFVQPGDAPRRVRLVRLDGVPQVQIRSSAADWDTGGVFSLLVHVPDVDAAFREAQALGWSAYHDPVEMHFSGRVLRKVVLRGWDGVNFGLYRAQLPPPPEPRHAGAGIAFNGQQSVRDIGAARAFYRDLLGWTPWFDDVLRLDCNNLGMPANHVGRTPMNVVIAAASRDAQGAWNYGQVELVEWVEFRGLDLAARAVPPNLGILALRVPVADAAARAAGFAAAGLVPFVPPVRVELAPHGEVLLFAVRSPDGAIIEFFEPVAAAGAASRL
jgi:catechol 2,3-dioxygenase-like lactoylglutathione lyase family enzyme